MEEEEFDKMNFANRDIVYISGKSTSTGRVVHNGNSSGTFSTVKRSSGHNYASVTKGRIKNERSRGKFKIVKLNDDGTGTVGKINLGSGRSSSRTISGSAAQRKIDRMRSLM